MAAAVLALAACGDGGPLDPGGPQAVWSVVVAPDTVVLAVGQSHPLVARAFARDSSLLGGRSVSWSTGDSAVASVNATGVVVARGPGSTSVRAQVDGKAGTAAIRVIATAPVQQPVARLALTPGDTLTLRAGATRPLALRMYAADGTELFGRPVTWTSTDEAIARVGADLLLHARSMGHAVVSAIVEGERAFLVVHVESQVARVELNPSGALLGEGETAVLSATPRDEAGIPLARPVAWSSRNTNVATVDAQGRVTGQAAGTAVIVAVSEGTTGEVEVQVAKWLQRDLVMVNDSLPPTTLYHYQSTDGDGNAFTVRVSTASGRLRVLPAGPGGGRYAMEFAVWLHRDGYVMSGGLYSLSGTYTRDPATGRLTFRPVAGTDLSGERLPDGKTVIRGRLTLSATHVTPEITLTYAAN